MSRNRRHCSLFAAFLLVGAGTLHTARASVIMELGRGVMHVAPDVPSRADYQPVSLASDGEVALAQRRVAV